jgi:hypothetical protein
MHRRNYLAGLAGGLPITAGCIDAVAPTNGLETESVQLRYLHQLHPRSLSYSGEKGSRLSSITTRDAASRLDLDQRDEKGRAQILSPSTHVERATTFVQETDFNTELLLLLTASVGDACHAFEIESMRREDGTLSGRASINQLDLQEECPDSIASIAVQNRAVLLSALVRVEVGQDDPTAAVVEVDPSVGEWETWKTKIAGS